MKEIVLNNKKNGMAVLLLTILLYLAGITAMILGGIFGFDKGQGWGVALFVVGIIWVGVGWFPALGLKVLKPQEALQSKRGKKTKGKAVGKRFPLSNSFS